MRFLAVVLVAFVLASSAFAGTPDPRQAALVSKRVFGKRWRKAACISWHESRDELSARNGANLGPFQINVIAHPWANRYRLTHSWRYSARVAYRISSGGRDWSAWTTAGAC